MKTAEEYLRIEFNAGTKMKDWDWTIEATDSGFYFFELKCIPSFGGGRYTREETDLASKEFSKIHNPDILRTKEEGLELIAKIREKLKSFN